MTLADMYNADLRAKNPAVRALAEKICIPHPLKNVEYADGMLPCTHARRHAKFELCR